MLQTEQFFMFNGFGTMYDKVIKTHLAISRAHHIPHSYTWRHTSYTGGDMKRTHIHPCMLQGEGGTGLLLGCMWRIPAERPHQAWVLPVVSAPFHATTPMEGGAGYLKLGTPLSAG